MLSSLVTSKAKRRVLCLLFLNSGGRFYVREIARKTGEQTNAVRNALTQLEKAGVLKSEWAGIQLYYAVNKQCPVFAEIRGLVLKSEGLAEILKKALEDLKIDFAFIYGSYATGKETSQSDIDLMIIGRPRPALLVRKIRQAEQRIGREINHAVYPREEIFSKKAKNFLLNVLKGPKIPLKGSMDELERLAEGKPHQADNS